MLYPEIDARMLAQHGKATATIVVLSAIVGGIELSLWAAGQLNGFVALFAVVPQSLSVSTSYSLLTHVVLHGSIIHFLFNMLMLWTFGPTLEKRTGTIAFAVSYFTFAVFTSLVFVVAADQSTGLLLGSSGAIAGVLTLYCFLIGGMHSVRVTSWLVSGRMAVPAGLVIAVWFLWPLRRLVSNPESVSLLVPFVGVLCGLVATMFFQADDKVESPTGNNGQPAEQPSTKESTPVACPYCGVAYTDDNRVGDRMFKCGNSACGRIGMGHSL